MNTSTLFFGSILLGLTLLKPAAAGVAVRFSAPSYEVTAEGETVVRLVIDGDDQTPGNQPVANGLFSFGVKISFPSTNAETRAEWLDVVGALDYSGLVPGAVLEQGEGFVVSKGNILLAATTSPAYTGVDVLSLTLRNRAPIGSRYVLTLGTARSRPSQTLFVDGKGNPLDDSISYGTAEVIVVPEPILMPLVLDIRNVAPGTVELSYAAQRGRDHFVEVSEDLVTWSDLFPVPRNEGHVSVQTTGQYRYFRLRTVDSKQ